MVAEGLGSLNVNAAKPPAPAASTANAGLEAAASRQRRIRSKASPAVDPTARRAGSPTPRLAPLSPRLGALREG